MWVSSPVDAMLSGLALGLEKDGFARNADGFFRVHGEFVDLLSVQTRSDNAAVALNAGVQPLFLLPPEKRAPSALRAMSETESYVRVRLAPEGKADHWLLLGRDLTGVLREAEQLYAERGRPFFAFFKSVRTLCQELTVERVRSGAVPEYFGLMTRSRLALLAAKAHLACDDLTGAKALAEYGLSVAGMAVSLKREFKRIIEEEAKQRS